MKPILPFCLFAGMIILFSEGSSQGCIAIRNVGSCSGEGEASRTILQSGEAQVGLGYRYFRSFRHFKGTQQQEQRVNENSEVINKSHAWDATFTVGLPKRFSLSVSVPFVYNDRSSLYEHGRLSRHSSYSSGLGDVRLAVNYWALNPEKHKNGNLQVGLGLKMPTGNFSAKSLFYNVGPNGSAIERPVDQSIQPGDGGWGFDIEAQFFHRIYKDLSGYVSGFYLFNPRNMNGTRTFRDSLSPLLANEAICSVPDQYQLRFGLSYDVAQSGVLMAAGIRLEGVPVRDALGKSEGFRRPGYILSFEPVISYFKHNFNVAVGLPVAVLRNRQQSLTDKQRQEATGQPQQGDAAFADFNILINLAYRFDLRKHKMTAAPKGL
jgi:hypothetical protein